MSTAVDIIKHVITYITIGIIQLIVNIFYEISKNENNIENTNVMITVNINRNIFVSKSSIKNSNPSIITWVTNIIKKTIENNTIQICKTACIHIFYKLLIKYT